MVQKVGVSYSWLGDVDGDRIDDILVNGIDGTSHGWVFVLGGWDDPLVDVDAQYQHSLPIFQLSQNYPNPFNPVTKITYSVDKRSHITLAIYDMLGRKISTLVDEIKQTGHYNVLWNGETDAGLPAASGVYIYRIQNGEGLDAKKMILLK